MKTLHAMQNTSDAYDPYDELAVAIIEQAIDDYRRLSRNLSAESSTLEKKRIEDELKAIAGFFLSDWYRILSSGEKGSHILQLLKQEIFGND